jgi:hypothetical protein
MSGASLRATVAARVLHRRACASLVASFAAGVSVWFVGGGYGGCFPA